MNAKAKFDSVEIPDTVTIGELIELKLKNQNQIDEINAALKEANKYKAEVDSRLIIQMRGEKQIKSSTDLMSIVITEERRPNITDIDAFVQYGIETGTLTAFIRRQLNVKSCKEIWDGGENIPGVEIDEYTKVNFRRN